MNLPLKMTGIALLLMLGMTHAVAEPGHSRRDERAAQRDDQSEQRQARQGNGQNVPNGGNVPDAAPDTPRKKGMTPEERHALRRQINEAGRDIYRPANR